jgi:hypothetical protein
VSFRLRKDPLDPIDSGTKVAILFKRLTDPEFAKREEEMKKRQVGWGSCTAQLAGGLSQMPECTLLWRLPGVVTGGQALCCHGVSNCLSRQALQANRCCLCCLCFAATLQEQAAQEAAKANKKSGAWGGLPSRR